MSVATMAQSPKWEVVTKKAKQKKQNLPAVNPAKLTKNQIKSFIENMPTLDKKGPVQESRTIFDAFKEPESKEDNQAKPTKSKTDNNQKKQQQQSQQKKKQPDKKKHSANDPPPARSLEEALSKFNIDEFRSFMSLTQERFPNVPLLWLKDMVSYLNIKLNVQLQDPIFSGKPVDYPHSIVPRDLLSTVNELLGKCPNPVLNLFFEHMVTTIVEETVKGLGTGGYRIVVQCLAFNKPEIVLNNLQKFKDFRNQHQNRQPVGLSILWALGQGGVKDLACGLKIWLEMMLPVLGLRAYSKYTIDYLDVLFRQHSGVFSCGKVLGIREFFPVMDMIFSHSANLQPQQHKQLLGLYPKLKTVALGPEPEQVLRNFFPSFLVRLVPSCPLLLKNELLSCLTMCLATDKHCYSVWRQLYTKHLVQSSLLMQHLNKDWDTLKTGFPKKLLKETLGTFKVTNDELEAQGKQSIEGYKEATRTCNVLLRKMSMAAMLPWRLMLLLFITLVGGMLVYDVNAHGSFEASKTGRVLNDIGFINVCNHAWYRVQIYSGKFYRWSEENIPFYYNQFCNFVDPYIKLFWQQLYAVGVFVADQSKEVRQYLNKKLPLLLKWVDENVPGLIEGCAKLFSDASTAIRYYVAIGLTTMIYYFQLSAMWLQENVFTGKLSPENLQKCAHNTVEVVQEYTNAAYKWVAQQLAGLTAAATK